ncbi:MAG: hypothetical protein AAGA58_00140 [Verrucomicrobiota bacterium]
MSETIASIAIDDPVESHERQAIEVTITMKDGTRRWCFFVTPEGIPNYGDFLDSDHSVRIHFGASHMIVVSRISEDIVLKTLYHIDKVGEIERSTLEIKDTEQVDAQNP